jgi:chemosensory pili system protein ChpA (sensor histidine kinase/response regulator)
MIRQVKPEVLAGFIDEAKGYLPHIQQALEAFRADTSRRDYLEDVYRPVHTIRGAAAMVGLSSLSFVAHLLELALEELALGQLELHEDFALLLAQVVGSFPTFLDGKLSNSLDEPSWVIECAGLCRLLRKLPEAPDPELDQLLQEIRLGCVVIQGQSENETLPFDQSAFEDPTPKGNEPAPFPADALTLTEFPDLSLSSEPFEEPPSTITDAEEAVAPELVEVFALEAEEHLRTISTMLPVLEQEPQNREALQEIRRSAHTLKGAAGMVGFQQITQLAHRMEDLLDLLFEGSLSVTPEITQLLFASNDVLEDMATGKKETARAHALFAKYAELLPHEEKDQVPSLGSAHTSSIVRPVRDDEPSSTTPEESSAEESDNPTLLAARKQGPFVRIPIERLDELTKLVSELVINRTAFEQRMADLVRQADDLEPSTGRLKNVSYKLQTGYEASALGSSGGSKTTDADPRAINRLLATYQTHGFDDLQFDRYTEFHLLTRDLAETTSDIQTTTGELRHVIGDFEGCLTRQTRLTSEIEDKLMRLRMVPLATLATRLQRTVRNAADQKNKQVDLVLEGETTELDKTMLEQMVDPFMHLLRNAVDHGIEPPEVRLMKAKPEKGTIRLKAFQEGGQVVIQVRDDGAGVDLHALRSTAVARGFVEAGNADNLAEEDLHALLFMPGFTTAQVLSEISGRGVGLDIVKAQVSKLKGTIALQSQPGIGATFTIRLPLTLAITRALLIKSHQETFAIPLDAIREIQRLDRQEIDYLGDAPVARIGGGIYPLLSLDKVLTLKHPADNSVSRPPVLLLGAGAKRVALVVDHILGGKEIVIKNLGSHLRHVRGISGATLMGNGSVVLILNPADLVRESSAVRAPHKPATPSVPSERTNEVITVMVVDDSQSVRRVMTGIIQGAGWKSITAKDGLEALETLHQSAVPPDLVLLDVEMPRMDGYQLLSNLRAQKPYQHLPVVMVTSRAGEKHRRKALDLGASGYVIKPFQEAALLNIIRHLVQESRQGVMA